MVDLLLRFATLCSMSRQLNLRIPDSDYEALESSAREAGLSPMQHARALVLRGIRATVTAQGINELIEELPKHVREPSEEEWRAPGPVKGSLAEELAPLAKPSPPRKKPVKAGIVCSECTRKNGGRPRRGCPNGCDRNRSSALEQFDVDALEEK